MGASPEARYPSDLINVRFTKYGGGGHWEFVGTLLSGDEHGTWVGCSTGTELARPGHAFRSGHDWVTLFPDGQPWVATFRNSPDPVTVYVDITTAPVWSGPEVSMVDLDLDVVLTRDGTLLLDDEDEFEEHRVTLAYPSVLVALARRAAEVVSTSAGPVLGEVPTDVCPDERGKGNGPPSGFGLRRVHGQPPTHPVEPAGHPHYWCPADELHVAYPQRGQLARAQSGESGHQHQGAVPGRHR